MNKYFEAQSWCLAKGIKIYMVPIKYSKKCYVEVDNNGKIQRSPHMYKNQSVGSDKIWDLYLFLYKKLKDDKKN